MCFSIVECDKKTKRTEIVESLLHDAMHSVDYIVARLYISVSLAGIPSKWLNISSDFFYHLVATLFHFFSHQNGLPIF